MHCGYPHPDLLRSVLSLRRQRELEIYSQIEPIGGMVEVSHPQEQPAEMTETKARSLFDRIKKTLGKKRKK